MTESSPDRSPKIKKIIKLNENDDKPQQSTLIPYERIGNALDQLTKYSSQKHNNQENLLIDNDELDNQLQLILVNNKSFTGNKKILKPKLLSIKHSIFKPWKDSSQTSIKDFKILLILKDDDNSKITQDDIFERINSTVEIICGNDLKTTYKSFESRRSFISNFQLILSDDSLITALPKLLGNKAYNKLETTPIPIKTNNSSHKFNSETVINQIEKIYLTKFPIKLPRGNTLNAHLGNMGWFTRDELIQNILSISTQMVQTYSIRSIFIKLNESPVLPLYISEDAIEELASKKVNETTSSKEQNFIIIDGIEIKLTNFEKSLMEIANPDDYSKLFIKQINKAKRKLEDVPQCNSKVECSSKKSKS